MKKTALCAATLMMALALPSYASSKQEVAVVAAPGAVTLAEAVSADASITAIDSAKKSVTLRNTEGQLFNVVVGEKVKNFDKLKVGDKVKVEYLQALQLELLHTGSKVSKRIVETQVASAANAKMGKAAGAQLTLVGNVDKVDAKNQTIVVKGVDKSAQLKVRDAEQFKLIKKGDQIKAVYTEAIALGVVVK